MGCGLMELRYICCMKKHLLPFSLFVNLVFVGLIVRHFVLSPEGNNKNSIGYFVSRDKVLKELPKDRKDILFVGDSEMQGFDVQEYFSTLRVKNRGIYYDTSLGVLNRSFDIAEGKPAAVFIEIGLNDLQRGVAIDSINLNVRKAVQIIITNSPETKIYLLSVIPSTLVDDNQRAALNKLLSRLQTANVKFVDLDPYLLENKGLAKRYDVGDKIHLNTAGYVKLTEILMPYVKE